MQSLLDIQNKPDMTAEEKLEEITPAIENLTRILSLHNKLSVDDYSITNDEYTALMRTLHHLVHPVLNVIKS